MELIDLVDSILKGAQFLATLGLGACTYMLNRRKASQQEAEAARLQLAQLQERILTMELKIAHMPDDAQLDKLNDQMGSLAGDMKGMRAEMTGVARELAPLSRSVERINDYLLTARSP